METIAGWVAPIATTIAACMTAANLGPRLTGWGFVVFSIGAIAWAAIGLATGQDNLVWQNGILLVIDLIGIWRWLGREARYEEGGRHAAIASRQTAAPTLFPVSRFSGCPVTTAAGETIATTVDAMAECGRGTVSYLVVREGGVVGVGERLHAIDWSDITVREEGFATALSADQLARLPTLEPDAWPHAA